MNLSVAFLGDYHTRCLGLLDDVEERARVELGDDLEQREGERASDDGARRQHLLRLLAETLEASTDDEAHALRDVELVDRDVGAEVSVRVEDLAFLDEVTEHLLDEERVPLRFLEDGTDDLIGRCS